MAEIYLIVLVMVLAAALMRGLAAPARMYEFPYFMSAVIAVFLVPQAISLIRFPAGTPLNAIDAALLMTVLCALACILGYRAAPNRWIIQRMQAPIDERRLFQCGILFICCGIFFTYLIGQMSSLERGGSRWTGRVTIYMFFANLSFPGLSICLRQALARGGSVPWLWTVIGAWIPIVASIVYGRREPTVLLALTVALTLYFSRRKAIPRWIMVIALVVATIGIPATTQYRMAMNTGELSAISQIDFVGNFKRFLSQPSILELRNGAMLIEKTVRTNDYGFGRAYWDQLVFSFVPAQIFGRQFKEGLMFDPGKQTRQEEEFAKLGYESPGGTTMTGIGDSFREFGYFGPLFFAGLAVIFKSLWYASVDRSSVFAQLLYIQTCTPAMLSITHQTTRYPPGLVYNLIFLGLVVMYSRSRQSTVASGMLRPTRI